MSFSRPLAHGRYAWACAVLLLAGCSGETGDFLPKPQSSAAPEGAIAWQEGSGGTRTYLGSGQVIRCWKLSNRFDCLHAQVFDRREQIADAPVRRAYYRFVTSRLPDRMSELDGFDISDGYECSTSSSPGRASLLEAIWKNRRIVEQSTLNQLDSTEVTWNPQEIAALFAKHAVAPRRPAFACSLVDEIAAKMGLEALDSPLVTYQALTQTEGSVNAAAKGDDVAPAPSR